MPTKKDRQRISAEDRVRRAALNPPRSPIYEMDLAHLIRNIRDEDSGFSIVTHDQAARLAQQLMVLCKITLREAP